MVLVAMAALCLVVPAAAAAAAAQRNLIIVQGQLKRNPSPTPIAALASLEDAGLFAQFVVDNAAGSFVSLPAPLGIGTSGIWLGMASNNAIFVSNPGGTTSIIGNANDLGGIFLIDNTGSSMNPDQRLDQAIISSGARIANGQLVLPFDILGSLPPDVFISSLAFGRSQSTLLPNQPDLVTSLARPDFPSLLLAPGSQNFLQIQFRQGTATTDNELRALPAQSMRVSGLSFSIVPIDAAVPEPSSWAMLIAGFGLVGATARRRRLAAAA